MIDLKPVIAALVVFLLTASLFALFAGIRRIPWRHAGLVGVGSGIVWVTVWAASQQPIDPATLVLVGAVGGSLAQRGFERGEQERHRISDQITSIQHAPPV